VNTHTSDLDPASQIPKPFDQTHSVGIEKIRAIVAALDALKVPRSGRRVASPSGAQSTSVADADDRLFAEIERAGTPQAYGYYLDELPEGRHVLVARYRLKALQPAALARQPGAGVARVVAPETFVKEAAEELLAGNNAKMTTFVIWAKTPQGHAYWTAVQDELEKNGTLPAEAVAIIQSWIDASVK
jgi:hypothetical protein